MRASESESERVKGVIKSERESERVRESEIE